MTWRLALRNLLFRPWRTVLLLAGYGLGVAVMVVLLAVGDAMIAQASDEKLVGGGTVTVLPEGLDVEVMKTGGVGGMFFSIANARFVFHQLLASPRLAGEVRAVAPQVEGKPLYVTPADGREVPVRAGGELPGATRAVGGAPPLAAGTWTDDDGDRRWRRPTDRELRHDLDHFHLPPADLARRESWGEWHYFNVLWPDASKWAFITFLVGGDVPRGEWGGQLLVTLHERGRPARRFSRGVRADRVRFATHDADLALDDARVTVDDAGRYRIRASVPAEAGGGRLSFDLVVTPAPRAWFPGATLVSGASPSGYAVLGLRAQADGTVCVDARCEALAGVQGYHDHNWGTWQGVTWDWGASRAGAYTLLYGRVRPPDDARAGDAPLFAYLVDSLGYRAVFRPRTITYEPGRTVATAEGPLEVPARARLRDVRGTDTLDVVIDVDDATATDTRAGLIERGEGDYARRLATPWFLQLQGRLTLRGRVGGRPIGGTGHGFFETYR